MPFPFVFPLILFAFVVVWTALLTVLSYWSGWRDLAREYPASGPIDGPRWRFQSAMFRAGANYSGGLNITVNSEGMHVSMFPLFRINHAPFFLPWADLTATYESHWYGSQVCFIPAKLPRVPFRIEERLAKKIAAAIGDVWPAAKQ